MCLIIKVINIFKNDRFPLFSPMHFLREKISAGLKTAEKAVFTNFIKFLNFDKLYKV